MEVRRGLDSLPYVEGDLALNSVVTSVRTPESLFSGITHPVFQVLELEYSTYFHKQNVHQNIGQKKIKDDRYQNTGIQTNGESPTFCTVSPKMKND